MFSAIAFGTAPWAIAFFNERSGVYDYYKDNIYIPGYCQQGAEKALKGFLVFHDTDPGNTHNINTTLLNKSVPRFLFLSPRVNLQMK